MLKKPKGTQDIFGKRQGYRQFVINTLETISEFYNFKKMDTPIFESSDLFKRSSGETSDIVNKEMYIFEDKKGREFALRPEGTASIIRSFVENKIYANAKNSKIYYEGPMFRYERPQRGRQRQFTQFGIETIGYKNPSADVEVIMMANQILDSLKIRKIKLLINSIGDKKTRSDYSKALKKYLEKYKKDLSPDSIKRLETNPLRILDDKVDGNKDFVKNAPKISEFYSKESKKYFEEVLNLLDAVNIKYEISDKLVRGLDYYSETIFEFVSTSEASGSQATIIGGGRYDNLVKQLGGPELSGVGFGLGVERLVNEVELGSIEVDSSIEVFIINIDDTSLKAINALVYMLRLAGFKTDYNYEALKINKGFDKAKKLNSKFVIIAGPKELKEGKVNIKNQKNGVQKTIEITKLIEFLDVEMEGQYEKNK